MLNERIERAEIAFLFPTVFLTLVIIKDPNDQFLFVDICNDDKQALLLYI